MLIYLEPLSLFPELHSDTIFGALTYAIKELYGEEKVKEMRETLNEWNKDEEIQKLEEEKEYITNHCLLGGLSDKEIAAIKEFKNKHYKTCCGNGKYKSKGNTWRYEISGTGIGHMIRIQCVECNEWLDVTDIDNW